MGSLNEMIGKSVVIDGCHVGYATEIIVTDKIGEHLKMNVEIIMTDATYDKLREYEHIMQVMG